MKGKFVLIACTACTVLYLVSLNPFNNFNEEDMFTVTQSIEWDLVVPDDYPSIQAAVDHAEHGFRILVKKGFYRENVVVDKEGVCLHGVNREQTVIDGGKTTKHTVKIEASDVTLENFTIRNGWNENEALWDLSGIRIESSNATIRSCIVEQNRLGINVLTGSYNLTIENNSFVGDGILLGNYVYSCKLNKKDFLHNIVNNTVNDKPLHYFKNTCNLIVPEDAGQIILANCTNITIEGVYMEKTDFSITLGYCSSCRIRNLTVDDTDGEIILFHSKNCVLENITASRSLVGICLDFKSENNVIRYNEVYGNWVGVSILTGSSDNHLYLNNIHDNAEGIAIGSYCNNLRAHWNTIERNAIQRNNIGLVVVNESYENVFKKNTVVENRVGVLIKSSNNNFITMNIFRRNLVSATFLSCSANSWDENYWSRPRFLPKIIIGCRKLGWIQTPWVNIDFHPLRRIPT